MQTFVTFDSWPLSFYKKKTDYDYVNNGNIKACFLKTVADTVIAQFSTISYMKIINLLL